MKAFKIIAMALFAGIVTGCSGISAHKTFTPLDFILPGLLQNDPAVPVDAPVTNSIVLTACADQTPK